MSFGVLAGVLLLAAPASQSVQLAQAYTPPTIANDPQRALPAPQRPPAGERLTPPAAPAEPAAASADERARFTLNSVEFTGLQSLDPGRLEPAWARFKGQPVSLADLRSIGSEAEAIYAEAGRPFVAVFLTPQKIENGVVRFEVVEGRISDLTVLGADPVARRQATAVLGPLVDKQPLTLADVETAYELSRGVPGLSVSGALRRGSQPGGMDLVVQAERRIWRSYANLNNLYADAVGPWGVLAGADYFGASRFGDVTSLQVFSTLDFEEQQVLRLSHSRRLNPYGLTLSATGLVATAEPKGNVADLNIATDVTSGRIDLSHPLIQRTEGFAVASLGLDVSDQETLILGTVDSDEKLRILSVSVSGEYRRPMFNVGEARLAFSTELRQGLKGLGASEPGDPNLSRESADPQGTVLRARIEAETPLTRQIRFNVRLEGQRTEDSLTAPEEYSVGNLSIGRGYDPGSLFGDSAAAVAAELRFGPYPAWRYQVQPFVFHDAAIVWNEADEGPNGREVASSGVGLRFELAQQLRLEVQYAFPHDEPLGLGDSKPQPSLFINVTAGLDDVVTGLRRRMIRRTNP